MKDNYIHCFTAICAGHQKALVRLVNGSSPNGGRVEVWMNGRWKPVCANKQDKQKNNFLAVSVCSALGYSEESKGIISQDKPVILYILQILK